MAGGTGWRSPARRAGRPGLVSSRMEGSWSRVADGCGSPCSQPPLTWRRPATDPWPPSRRPPVDLALTSRGPGSDLALAGSDPGPGREPGAPGAGAVKFAAGLLFRGQVHGSTPQVHARYTGCGTRPRPSIGWLTASRGLARCRLQEPGWLAAVTTGRGDERKRSSLSAPWAGALVEGCRGAVASRRLRSGRTGARLAGPPRLLRGRPGDRQAGAPPVRPRRARLDGRPDADRPPAWLAGSRSRRPRATAPHLARRQDPPGGPGNRAGPGQVAGTAGAIGRLDAAGRIFWQRARAAIPAASALFRGGA